MKTFSKVVAFIGMIAILFSLVGCGKKSGSPEAPAPTLIAKLSDGGTVVTSLDLEVGQIREVEFSADTAKISSTKAKKIEWDNSVEKYVSIERSGTTFKIKALAATEQPVKLNFTYEYEPGKKTKVLEFPVTVKEYVPTVLVPSSTSEEIYVSKDITIDLTTLPGTEGNETQGRPLPEDAVVDWTSSNSEIATVEDGTVTGVAAGEATITATYKDLTATVTVTVKDFNPTELKASIDKETLKEGETAQITLETEIEGGESVSLSCDKVVFSEDDAVSIDENGVVTANKVDVETTVNITVTYTYKETDYTDEVSVTVLPYVATALIASAENEVLQLSGEDVVTTTITLTTEPDSKPLAPSEAIFTVDGDAVEVSADGVVTAKKPGTATVTVKYGEFTDTIEFTVNADPNVAIDFDIIDASVVGDQIFIFIDNANSKYGITGATANEIMSALTFEVKDSNGNKIEYGAVKPQFDDYNSKGPDTVRIYCTLSSGQYANETITVTITGTIAGQKYESVIKIVEGQWDDPNYVPTELVPSCGTEVALYAGDSTDAITFTMNPNGKKLPADAVVTLTVEEGSDAVEIVDNKIVACNAGTAVVTASFSYKEIQLTATINVTVSDYEATGLAIGGLDVKDGSLTLKEGEESTLTLTTLPGNKEIGDRVVEWASDNLEVAEVVDGIVTALAEGSATITASSEGLEAATISVTVRAKTAGIDWESVAYLGDGAGGGMYNNKYKFYSANGNAQPVNIQPKDGKPVIYVTFPAGISSVTTLSSDSYVIGGAGLFLFIESFTEKETTFVVSYAGGEEECTVYYEDGVSVPAIKLSNATIYQGENTELTLQVSLIENFEYEKLEVTSDNDAVSVTLENETISITGTAVGEANITATYTDEAIEGSPLTTTAKVTVKAPIEYKNHIIYSADGSETSTVSFSTVEEWYTAGGRFSITEDSETFPGKTVWKVDIEKSGGCGSLSFVGEGEGINYKDGAKLQLDIYTELSSVCIKPVQPEVEILKDVTPEEWQTITVDLTKAPNVLKQIGFVAREDNTVIYVGNIKLIDNE